MDIALISLATMELPVPVNGATVPEWIHLLPRGTFQARDGRGPWAYRDASAVINESFSRRKKIHVDENHSTDTAAKLGLSAPARGFIVEMEERDTGIWGRVDWNESGRELLADRAYWGVSPVITPDPATGDLLAIARVALTNDPALPDLLSLYSSTETPMLSAELAKMLGLAEDASDTDITIALQTRLNGDGADAALSVVGAAMGLEGDVTLQTVVTAAKGFKSARDAQAEQITALQTTVAGLQATGKQKAAEDFVDGAIRERRAGVKPARDEYIALHMENPAQCETIVAGLPKLDPTLTTLAPPAPASGEVALSSDHHRIAGMLGVDPADMAKNLTAEHGEAG